MMHDSVDKQLLAHLVKLTTILRGMPKEDVIAVLDDMEDIELQYLDLLLHDMSSALWNSNYHTEIQESWETQILFEPTNSPE